MSPAERDRVLIVEDDVATLEALAALVEDEGFEVQRANALELGRKALEADPPPRFVLTDLHLPDGEGTELIDLARERGADVVLITGEATVDSVVEALRLGASDYLQKPVDTNRLTALLKGFARTAKLTQRIEQLEGELQLSGRFEGIVGASEPMQGVFTLLRKVAPRDATVFIVGESGTGKELVARAVHNLSRRSSEPFVPLNCGAVSENLIESELFGHEKGSFTGAEKQRVGLFERANRGTLFLDEITEMPPGLQVKLLRVLETNEVRRVGGERQIPVDVRIVAATNRDPAQAVEEGALREDLYYRLRVFPIEVPALRERRGDVERLLRHFLERLNEMHGTTLRWSDEALEVAERYGWPGNVRELRNAVQRAHILGEKVLGPEHLPGEVSGTRDVDRGPQLAVHVGHRLDDVERRLIIATLRELDGHRQEAAELLGISVKTLYNRIKSYEESGVELDFLD